MISVLLSLFFLSLFYASLSLSYFLSLSLSFTLSLVLPLSYWCLFITSFISVGGGDALRNRRDEAERPSVRGKYWTYCSSWNLTWLHNFFSFFITLFRSLADLFFICHWVHYLNLIWLVWFSWYGAGRWYCICYI